MAKIADSAIGAILEIPPTALQKITAAQRAIDSLAKHSYDAANAVKTHWGVTALDGLDKFIHKVENAQTQLNNLKSPNVSITGMDGASIAAGISALAQSMASITKETTAGGRKLKSMANNLSALSASVPNVDIFGKIADGINRIGSTSQQSVEKISTLAQSMAQLAASYRTVQNAQKASAGEPKVSQINQLYLERIRVLKEIENINTRREVAQKQGLSLTLQETSMVSTLNARYANLTNQIETLRQKQDARTADAFAKGDLATTRAEITAHEKRQKALDNIENQISKKAAQENARREKNAVDAVNGIINAYSHMQKALMSTPQGAISYAKNARSLKELEDAYKNLRNVMNNMDPKSSEWRSLNTVYGETKKKIDDIRASMGELHNQSRRTFDIMGQLRNQMSLLFSVAAIKSYINQLVKVRAQFELQQTALRAIIQNKEEADAVFNKVQQMALQSPFTIMQLTTYTKQLSAYRIETEKLVGTTKMLADVSAGLGVDMQRLILAYGQVKAANYLRATEVRQFTEAGLNIAGELAKYFSELQGRMVSVGEVMDMITKRMVRFEDVEEVFRRVTSAGGLFYDMQKKQSETLYGQLQRIQDAFSLMLNSIGQSNEGTIISVVKGIRSLIESWRLVSWWVEKAAIVFGIYKAATILASIANSKFGKTLLAIQGRMVGIKGSAIAAARGTAILTGAMRGLVSAAKGAIAITIPGLLLWGLTELINKFAEARVKADELNEAMSRIGEESQSDLNGAIANFTRLADIISDTGKSYTEQQNAVDELRRSYGDIIGVQKLNSETIRGLNGDYRSLTTAIVEYYQAQEYRKKVEAIAQTTEFKDMRKELQDALVKMNEKNLFGLVFPENQVRDWANTVADDIANGKIPVSLFDIKGRIEEIFGTKIDWSKSSFGDLENYLEKYNENVGNITLLTGQAKNALEAYQNSMLNDKGASDKQIKDLDERIKKQKEYVDSLEKISRSANAANFAGFATQDEAKKALFDARTALESYRAQLQDTMAARGALMAQRFKDKFEEESKTLTEEVRKYWEATQALKSLEMQGKTLDPQYQKLLKDQKELKDSADKLAEEFNTEVPWSLIQTRQTTYELDKALVQVKESTFPSIATAAVKEMATADEAILKSKRGVQSFVDTIATLLPTLQSKMGSLFSGLFGNIFTGISDKVQGVMDMLDGTAAREESINTQLKARVKEFGADMKTVDNEIKKGADTPRELAKNLRGAADAWDVYVKAYDAAADKGLWSKINTKSKEEIEQMRKNVKATRALADDIWKDPEKEKKGGRGGGRDPWIEMFKLRQKAIEDFYKQYNTLREKYSVTESQKRDMESFEDYLQSVGADMENVVSKGWDTRGLVANLEEMEEEARKHFGAIYYEAKNILAKGLEIEAVVNPTAEQKMSYALAKLLGDLQKSVADNKIKIDFEIQDEAKKKVQESIDELFANYELTKELGNLGLNIDLTYLVGGKPKSLKDVRADLNAAFEAEGGKNGPKEIVKMYEDAFKKLADIEHKNQIEQIKNYNKYLLESMSERIKIEVQAQREIAALRRDETIDDTTRQMAILRRQQQMRADLSKQEWKDFQGSDMYISMFENIEHASTQSLEAMLAKLRGLRESLKGLPADQLRAIVKQIENVETQIYARNPFKALSDNIGLAIKSYKELKDAEERYREAQDRLDFEKKNRDAYALATGQIEEQLKIARAKNGVDEEGNQIEDALTMQLEEQLRLRRETLATMNANVTSLETEAATLGNLVTKLKQGRKAAGEALQTVGSWASTIANGIGDIASSLENVFGEMSPATADFVGSMQEILGGVGEMASGVGRFMTGDYLGGAVSALGGLAKTIGGIFNIGDKKKEREIVRLKEKVYDLDRAYQKLEKSIDAAFTFDQYNAGYDKMQANLKQQEKSYEEMIRLEEAKKKTDKDKVKEYTEALEAVREKQEELHKQRIEAMGSTTDYASEAENFVNAWLDAYREVGDGTEALKETWDEFIDNLFVKQAAYQLVSTRIKKYIEALNAAIDENKTDFDLKQIVNETRERFSQEAGDISRILEELFDAYGMSGAKGDFILSDLQKGIQNITEPQAAAIEAYLNSMRFAVFRHTEQLDTLIASVQAQYGAGSENPVVTELKGIRGVLDRIDNRLNSVIVNEIGRGSVVRVA